jgi:hypothetical protein
VLATVAPASVYLLQGGTLVVTKYLNVLAPHGALQ